jgi:hypothetical protein
MEEKERVGTRFETQELKGEKRQKENSANRNNLKISLKQLRKKEFLSQFETLRKMKTIRLILENRKRL